MFDDVNFDRKGAETIERVTRTTEDHLRALKIIRARLLRLDRVANTDPSPVLKRITQLLVHMGISPEDEAIGEDDKTYDSHPLPPLTHDQIKAIIADGTPPPSELGPVW